jgi:hypothetical protein
LSKYIEFFSANHEQSEVKILGGSKSRRYTPQRQRSECGRCRTDETVGNIYSCAKKNRAAEQELERKNKILIKTNSYNKEKIFLVYIVSTHIAYHQLPE